MRTSKEYRQHAKECLELANASTYVYVKTTLTELAEELDKTADRLESPRRVSYNKVKPRPFKLQAPSRHH
jgi:hypothetical protein